jgi:hypothetical protein
MKWYIKYIAFEIISHVVFIDVSSNHDFTDYGKQTFWTPLALRALWSAAAKFESGTFIDTDNISCSLYEEL